MYLVGLQIYWNYFNYDETHMKLVIGRELCSSIYKSLKSKFFYMLLVTSTSSVVTFSRSNRQIVYLLEYRVVI